MNLSELQAEIGRLLNDPGNVRWSPSVLTTRINEAQTVIQGYTKAVKSDDTLTFTANTAGVTLDADTMDILRVVVTRPNGDQFELEGSTLDELDFDYPNWRNLDDGTPWTWYYDATNQVLNFVPAPDANAVVTNGLVVTGVHKPADVANSSDIPFDSNNQMVPYHYSIITYVVSMCWNDDGTPDALAKSKFYRSGSMARPGEFENEIMRINAQFDNPAIPTNIKYQPQGGRIGGWWPTKSDPLGGW